MSDKTYYEKHLEFISLAAAEKVAELAASYGVQFELNGQSMYFFDGDNFDYVDYHYKMKMPPGDVKVILADQGEMDWPTL